MGRFKVGLQLFLIREDMKNDFEGCLKKIKDMGYDGVEFAGLYGIDTFSKPPVFPWAIDLNCFMVMFYRSMSFIAKELNKQNDCEIWAKKATALSDLINEKMWNDTLNSYCDVNRFTGEYSTVLTPASFMPLYVEIAKDQRAEAMAHIAKKNFNSKMPSVSFDNPEFSTNYWRGPTWLNIAYFAAKGLKNYNFPVADEIKENILNMCHKNKDGIFENYNSITEEGQRYNNFGWSCVFIMEFILNF